MRIFVLLLFVILIAVAIEASREKHAVAADVPREDSALSPEVVAYDQRLSFQTPAEAKAEREAKARFAEEWKKKVADGTIDLSDGDCTEDCSGHDAGREWAENNDISDPGDCGGKSYSFTEGCEEYAEEQSVREEAEGGASGTRA